MNPELGVAVGGYAPKGARAKIDITVLDSRSAVRLRLLVLPQLRPRDVQLLPRLSDLSNLAGGFWLGGVLPRHLLRLLRPAPRGLGRRSVYRYWQIFSPLAWSLQHGRPLGTQAWFSGRRAAGARLGALRWADVCMVPPFHASGEA